MAPLRTSRSLFQVLVWLPGALYGCAMIVALISPDLTRFSTLVFPTASFLLLAAGCHMQGRRIDQLEQALIDRRLADRRVEGRDRVSR